MDTEGSRKFLNLDYLIEQHFRLGVDTFFSYGLLPVLIQHWLFVIVGRGYWPLIGCAIITMILVALFCALLLHFLPNESIWFAAILAMSRIINPVNPNLPYSIVELSLLFALLFVLIGRLEISLAVSVIGCLSVPSLSLIMTVSLIVLIFIEWFTEPVCTIWRLLRALAPGVLSYFVLVAIIAAQFGWKSVFATATPIEGMSFYRKVNFGSYQALMQFLHPWGYSGIRYLVYILFTPAGWWVVSTILLALLAVVSVGRMVVERKLKPREEAIVLCALIQVVFVCFAYGAPHQHYLFDPILVVGVLLGLSMMEKRMLRDIIISVFVALGVFGQAVLVREVLQAWNEIRFPSATENLYAKAEWVAEWKKILDVSARHNLLLLSYSTGVHHYFPTIHSPNVWTLQVGQLLPEDYTRVIQQIDNADIVVLDLTSPTDYVDTDAEVKRHLNLLCLSQSTEYFQIWWRRSMKPADLTCIVNPRKSDH